MDYSNIEIQQEKRTGVKLSDYSSTVNYCTINNGPLKGREFIHEITTIKNVHGGIITQKDSYYITGLEPSPYNTFKDVIDQIYKEYQDDYEKNNNQKVHLTTKELSIIHNDITDIIDLVELSEEQKKNRLSILEKIKSVIIIDQSL